MIWIYILTALAGMCVFYLLFLFVCSCFVNAHREYVKDSSFYRALLYSFTGLMIKILRIKIHVEGMDKIHGNEKVLFVGNHRSNYDPIITWHVFRKWKIAFVSKESNFKIPIFGKIIRKCCFMSIDRSDPRKSMETINRAAKLLANQEVSVGIYPEGTRSKNCVILPFHNGVFKIAQKSSARIVVIAISGTEQIAANLLKCKKTHVYLKVLDVISGQEVKHMRTIHIGERVRTELINELDKMEK